MLLPGRQESLARCTALWVLGDCHGSLAERGPMSRYFWIRVMLFPFASPRAPRIFHLVPAGPACSENSGWCLVNRSSLASREISVVGKKKRSKLLQIANERLHRLLDCPSILQVLDVVLGVEVHFAWTRDSVPKELYKMLQVKRRCELGGYRIRSTTD